MEAEGLLSPRAVLLSRQLDVQVCSREEGNGLGRQVEPSITAITKPWLWMSSPRGRGRREQRRWPRAGL